MTYTHLANLPVIPVLTALERYPDARGRWWCPFHNDERPGGRPSAEVRDDPTALTCWSCGATVGAAELAAKIGGMSLREALDWCLTVAKPVETVTRPRTPPPSPARLEAELARQTTGIRYPHDVDPVKQFCQEKWGAADLAGEMTAYVKDCWGWAGDYRGRVVIPHRDAEGALTGLRWRVPPRWDKDGRPRSQFRQLYGLWRLGRAETLGSLPATASGESGAENTLGRRVPGRVWLCEGESDTVWAGYWLEPRGVGVVGVGTAGYRPRLGELVMLKDRQVVLPVHGDDAGQKFLGRWDAALDGLASEIVVVPMPPGRDLCTLSSTPEEVDQKL